MSSDIRLFPIQDGLIRGFFWVFPFRSTSVTESAFKPPGRLLQRPISSAWISPCYCTIAASFTFNALQMSRLLRVLVSSVPPHNLIGFVLVHPCLDCGVT